MKHLFLIVIGGLVFSLIGCNLQNSNNNPEDKSIPVEEISATNDQKERRSKSEDICKSREIPIYQNPNALFVPPESDVEIRTKDEVVDRAIALCYLGLKSEGLEQKFLDQFDNEFNASAKLTDNEKNMRWSIPQPNNSI